VQHEWEEGRGGGRSGGRKGQVGGERNEALYVKAVCSTLPSLLSSLFCSQGRCSPRGTCGSTQVMRRAAIRAPGLKSERCSSNYQAREESAH